MSWKRAIVAPMGTHHLLDGKPLYAARYHRVGKFHEPGLAPASDTSGSFHLGPDGRPAYPSRFRQAWGFYSALAAVEDAEGWFHVRADGSPLYTERYSWCGNFQEERCTVRRQDGRYLHIDTNGRAACADLYMYAGDFRDGAAVVRSSEDALCRHIDQQGKPLHGRSFLDLDVFHKGLARARDRRGWFHIRQDGQPAYARRFAAVEPFYNDAALAETLDGSRVVVGVDGATLIRVDASEPLERPRLPNAKVLVVGNIGAGKTTVASHLEQVTGWPHVAIDECRSRTSDGSPAGELAAWSRFVREAQGTRPVILEFSGSGPNAYLVKKALADAGSAALVLWVRTPAETCISRLGGRAWATPYPNFGVPLEAVVRDLEQRLATELGAGDTWAGSPVRTVDGAAPFPELRSSAEEIMRGWLGRTGA